MFLKNNKSVISIGIYLLLPISVILGSCKKFIAVGPPKTEIVAEAVFTSEASAIASLRGIYSLMISITPALTSGGLELFTGLAADELTNYNTNADQEQFAFNALSTTNQNVLNSLWAAPYKYINNANAIIEGLEKSSAISDDAKKRLQGEALFIRAYCYFYLVNLFGDVPYVTSSDYRVNAAIPRTEKGIICQKIITDLLLAQAQLPDDFSYSNNERNEPNKGVATALLSRLYLYTKDWAKAEEEASSLIDNINQYSLTDNLNDVFLLNSSETIWQLKPVIPGVGVPQAQLFILDNNPAFTPAPGNVSLSDTLLNSFEPGDKRKTDWLNNYNDGTTIFYYSYKYKINYFDNEPLEEYSMVFRLAEQYLIRAEARIQQDDIMNGIADINKLRQRARGDSPGDLPALADDLDKVTALLKVEQERKVELFTEGHRWFDLKRWPGLIDNNKTRADDILGPIKGANWQTTDILFPIPESERLINPSLSQNPGY